MGLFFKRTYKEKIALKLWDSFHEKENIIEDYSFFNVEGLKKHSTLDNNKIHSDVIIIANSGIYIFNIYSFKGKLANVTMNDKLWCDVENESTMINPYLELIETKRFILNILNNEKHLKVDVFPIFNELNKEEIEKSNGLLFNIVKFKDIVASRSKMFSDEEVNLFTRIIKEHGEYKK